MKVSNHAHLLSDMMAIEQNKANWTLILASYKKNVNWLTGFHDA
jgi:hypothetical protein